MLRIVKTCKKTFENENKKIKAKSVKRCNICGKKFDMWDVQESFRFHHRVGYGSKYDCYQLDLKLCCKCFDSLMDELVPRCKTNPLPDPFAELAAAYAEDMPNLE